MKKGPKKLIPAIIAIAICIGLLILAGAITSPVLRTIVTIALIAGIVVALLAGLIVMFANKAGQESPAAPQASLNKKSPLTPKQNDDLKKAGSQLTRVRMTLARFSDQKLAASGTEACDAIDKVLHTLKEKPEKIQTTRQLFNYYLPTMEQVVNRYKKLEASGVMNPEIPTNVQKYFGDIKEAMETQYEGLFDNDKLNVTVDMEAMTIALKRDGLLDEEDFKKVTAEAASEAIPDVRQEAKREAAEKPTAEVRLEVEKESGAEVKQAAAEKPTAEIKLEVEKEPGAEVKQAAAGQPAFEAAPASAPETIPPTALEAEEGEVLESGDAF